MTDDHLQSPRPAVKDRPQPALLRCGPVVGFGLLLLGLARHAASGVSDPDTLWHVLAGQHLWTTWDFAGPDPLSRFTTGPWVLNQWLPDLGLAAANAVGGLAGVVWLAQLGRIAVCVAIYVSCRRVAGTLPAAVVAAGTVLATADSLSPRPQLVGFVLLAVTVSAWLGTAKDLRPRWWLLAIGYVWACSHGTWVVGVSVGAAVLASLVFERRGTRRQLLRIAVIPVLSAASALVTPVGPELLHSFSTVRAVSPYIQEWRTPSLDSPSVVGALLLAILPLLAWATRRQRLQYSSALPWLLAVAWGASSMRTVAVGAIVVAPLAASALAAMLGRPRAAVDRTERWILGVTTAASLILSLALAAAGPSQPTGVPSELAPALRALPTGTVVYNTDLLGGWLMWSFPDLEHTGDTRAELYGGQSARNYLAALRAEPGWDAWFARFSPGAALLEEDVPLVGALRAQGWHEVARDRGYILMAPGAG